MTTNTVVSVSGPENIWQSKRTAVHRLEGLNFTVDSGEFAGIMGASGPEDNAAAVHADTPIKKWCQWP